jgi:hypothetical protein
MTARPDLWRTLALAAYASMEIAWITPWYFFLTLTPLQGWLPARVFVFFWVLYLAAAFLLPARQAALQDANRRRWLLGGLTLVAELIGLWLLMSWQGGGTVSDFLARINVPDSALWIPQEFVVIGAILWVVYRGSVAAREKLGSLTVMSGFRWGVALLLIYGGLTSVLGMPIPLGLLSVFLVFSLLTLSLGRIAGVSHQRGGQRIPFDWRKTLGIGAAVIGMMILSLLIIGLVTGEPIYWLLRQVYQALAYLFFLVAAPVIWVITQLFEWLQPRLATGKPAPTSIPTPALEPLPTPAPGDAPAAMAFPPTLGLILIGALVLVAVIFILLNFRVGASREAAEEAEYEALQADDVLTALRGAARQSWQSLAGRLRGLGRSEDRLAAARVRQIYAELLDLCDLLERPRPECQTPLEFLPALTRLFPDSASALRLITEAYQRVRYGELPETLAEIGAVETAWKQIMAEGEALLAERKRHAPSESA